MAGLRSGGITVGELLRTPSFGLELLAGEGGLERRVGWTHSSELEDPAPWLDGDELLFTLGIGVPAEPAEQVTYVQRLADRRAAALAIGGRSPALSDEMLSAADVLGMPVLRVPAQTPFLAISRTVGAANLDTAQRRLVTHLQIFDAMAKSSDAEQELPDLLGDLEQVTGYRFYVVATEGRVLIESAEPLPVEVVERLAWVTDSRPSIEEGYAVRLVLGNRVAGFLVALEQRDARPSGLSAVRHVSTVIRMWLSEVYRMRERERDRGARLLQELLLGQGDSIAAARELDEAGIDPAAPAHLVAIALGEDAGMRAEEIDHRLRDARIPHLMVHLDALYMLVPDLSALELCEPVADLPIGVSRPIEGLTGGVPLARREALWSVARARSAGGGIVVHFGEPGYSAHWLPPDLSALEQLVEVYLGPVFAYDSAHNADLTATLATFFRHQRRLGPAAEELFVHKNTLTYRLRQIEEISGRDPTDLEQQSQMWLALKALAVVDATRVADDERLRV
jgi:PucR family transcriptional regulator, purine catabolism regulatory protein